MVGLGFYFIALFAVAFVLASKRQLTAYRSFLWVALLSLPLPWVAAELGWIVAEVGRQPWVIEGVLPTFLAVSSISAANVWITLIGFVAFYSTLAVVDVYLMVKTVRPDRPPTADPTQLRPPRRRRRIQERTMFDYEIMRLIWWALLGILLIGFAVMDGFDLGVAMLLPFVARTDIERRIVINTIGPVWEGNQVWLILGGGAIFAAWPMLYATAFSGFYLAMFIVLAALILRPVAIKFRSKIEDARWRSTWDMAIAVSGLVPALIFGVAFGNVIVGVPFRFDDTLRMTYEGSLFGLLNPFALLSGLISVAMLTLHGASYLALKASGIVVDRAVRVGRVAAPLAIVLFILAGVWVAFGIDGYVITSQLPHDGPSNPLFKKVVTRQAGAWLTNYRLFPWTLAAPVAAVAALAITPFLLAARRAGAALSPAAWASPRSSRPPASAFFRSCCPRRWIRAPVSRSGMRRRAI